MKQRNKRVLLVWREDGTLKSLIFADSAEKSVSFKEVGDKLHIFQQLK